MQLGLLDKGPCQSAYGWKVRTVHCCSIYYCILLYYTAILYVTVCYCYTVYYCILLYITAILYITVYYCYTVYYCILLLYCILLYITVYYCILLLYCIVLYVTAILYSTVCYCLTVAWAPTTTLKPSQHIHAYMCVCNSRIHVKHTMEADTVCTTWDMFIRQPIGWLVAWMIGATATKHHLSVVHKSGKSLWACLSNASHTGVNSTMRSVVMTSSHGRQVSCSRWSK